MTGMRLQKFLSSAGICSRRQGEKYIQQGLVKINGRVVVELGTRVDPVTDRVECRGVPVKIEHPPIYIALNKPCGYVSSCAQSGAKIVLDLIDIKERVYPVGRLDKDSSGLLLLTNDGRLHHQLSHPSFDHENEYIVTVTAPLTDAALAKKAAGLPMMGTRTRPAQVTRLSGRRFSIVLQEGKNRQIRRMVRKIGNQVGSLERIRMANIRLGRLEPGKWRYLSERERSDFLKMG